MSGIGKGKAQREGAHMAPRDAPCMTFVWERSGKSPWEDFSSVSGSHRRLQGRCYGEASSQEGRAPGSVHDGEQQCSGACPGTARWRMPSLALGMALYGIGEGGICPSRKGTRFCKWRGKQLLLIVRSTDEILCWFLSVGFENR